MATQSGTNASVKLGTTLVSDMSSWSVTDNRDALKAPVFGTVISKVHGMGERNINGTVSGYLNIDDDTGQDLLRSAYTDGTALTNFRLYINSTDYWTGTEVYITSMPTSASQNEIIPVEFNFEVSDNWTLTEG